MTDIIYATVFFFNTFLNQFYLAYLRNSVIWCNILYCRCNRTILCAVSQVSRIYRAQTNDESSPGSPANRRFVGVELSGSELERSDDETERMFGR